MKKHIALIVVVALVVAGLFVFKPSRFAGGNVPTVTQALSFMCDDGSYFAAVFMSNDTLDILVDGRQVRTVQKEPLDRVQYDDETHTYIFAGEKVTVANKEERTMVTCNQPFDPNNAPVNFDDAE